MILSLSGCHSLRIFNRDSALQVPKWFTSEFPPAVKAKVNRLWGGEWHGHAHKWCAFVFLICLLVARTTLSMHLRYS